jgi:gas vesicle protein
MKDVSKMMMLLGAGFLAGAITGILFAPDKGEKTRDRIRSKASELGEDIEKTYDDEIERLKSKIDKVKTQFSKKAADIVKDAEINVN